MKKKLLTQIISIAAAAILITGCSCMGGSKESAKAETAQLAQQEQTETASAEVTAITQEPTAAPETSAAPETTAAPQPTTPEETTFAEVTEPVRFLFFGIDTVGYTSVDQNRSDIIMVMQLNPLDKTIKFVSILRDTQVPIDGNPQKINGAYQIGGPQKAMDIVNEFFGLDITEYITMNFAQTVILIDDIGGVDVEMSAKEAATVNSMVWWDIVGDGRNQKCVPLPEQDGTYHLDGEQALMFSRIRAIDSDYYRAGRQHRTLKAIIEKIKTMPRSEYPTLVKTFLSTIQDTSYELDDILPWIGMGLENYEVSSYIVPDPDYNDDLWGGIAANGQWVWTYDLAASGERIRSILATEEE